jgi:serine/threonine protein kinase
MRRLPVDKFPEIPGYTIEKKLGESSLAKVFMGVQEDLERVVAVKILNPILMKDEAFARRFMEEARNAIKVTHPNIANILEAGKWGDIYYIVVENLPESLRDKINRQFNIEDSQSGQLEIERGTADFTTEAAPKTGENLEGARLLDILKQLVEALEYAHENGSLHKNIRPENIRFREDGTPVLVDLFISNILGPDYLEALKSIGITFGSAYYQSPEQAQKKMPDNKSDVYSLGVVFYEMLTGQVPYSDPGPDGVANQHIMDPVPQLPAHLKAYQPLLDRMMAKDKEARISAGIELIELIDELMHLSPSDMIKQPTAPQIPADQPMPPPMPIREEPSIPFEIEGPLEALDSLESMEPVQPVEPLPPMEPMKPMRPAEPSIKGERRIQKIGKRPTESSSQFSSLLSNPRMLISIAGVIVVIVILVIVVIKPFSSGNTGSNQTTVQAGQAEQRPLTEEERLELENKERLFKHRMGLAENFLNKGEIQKAEEKLKEAGTFITTPHSKKLLEDMKLKVSKKKDDEAFKNALAAGTIPAVEDYLQQYPSGDHVNEANEALKRLNEEKRRKEAEQQRILAAMIKLRSQYKDLSVNDVKSMLKERGFFEKYYNKSGGFKNHFDVKTIEGAKIVVDFATGLVWHQFGSESYMSMERVEPWLEDLNKQAYAGYSDWRLPTLEEAASLLENHESNFGLFIDEVFANEQRFIWTGDTAGKDKNWVIDFYSGDISMVTVSTLVYVRPVCTLKEFTL